MQPCVLWSEIFKGKTLLIVLDWKSWNINKKDQRKMSSFKPYNFQTYNIPHKAIKMMTSNSKLFLYHKNYQKRNVEIFKHLQSWFQTTKFVPWNNARMGSLKSWFWNITSYIFCLFFPKIVPKKRGYFEKQSRIIVIYLNITRTYNSVTFQKVCLENTWDCGFKNH